MIKSGKDGDQYSMDVSGPILPHTVLQLTDLLRSSVDSFGATLNPVISTLPFCKLAISDDAPPQVNIFSNLHDITNMIIFF